MEKETAVSRTLTLSEQTNQPSKIHSNSVVSNLNCARELMFGRAPLSISGKMHDKFLDVSLKSVESNRNNTGVETTKRKRCNVGDNELIGNEVSMSEIPLKVIKIVDNTIQKENTDDANQKTRENCGKLVHVDAPQSLTIPKNTQCNGDSTDTVKEKQTGDSSGAVNFHNNTCLQADWSLPCFRAVENQVSGEAFIGDRMADVKESIQDTLRCDHQNNSDTLNERTSGCETETTSTYNGGKTLESDLNTKLSVQSNSQLVKIGCQESSPKLISSTQQQLFQSLQLESSEGEVVVMSSSDNNGHLILLPQPHLQSQLKMDLQSLQVNNQNRHVLPISASHAGINHGIILHQQNESSCLQLNSSGEEMEQLNDTRESVSPQRTPYPSMLQKQVERAKQTLPIHSPLYGGQDDADPSREQHNHKERLRRARIRDACHLMRQIVPGMSDKTDKATVFEFAARYVHFLRTFVGEQYDKDFLMKYSPY